MQDASRDSVTKLAALIQSHAAKVGVIGLGYVGLPLALTAGEQSYSVIGFDIDGSKVELLNNDQCYIKHISPASISALRKVGRFVATDDFSRLAEVDVVILCVPTPLTRQREPDLSFVEQTTKVVAQHLRPGQLVVLESTTYPGTTREVMKPILEETGLRSGTDFFLAYSPEREDPGNPDFVTRDIPKVVGGDGPEASRLAADFYSGIVSRTIMVSSLETAEAVKITENVFRSVNIALVNELKVVFEAMGIDVWDVIEAAKTKPFGYMPFYPGPGTLIRGHCIPIDPFYLTWKAREFEVATRFIELAGEINTAMPSRIVAKAAEALNERAGRALNGAKVLILGIAYKKNVEDIRESPAFKIIELLQHRHAEVAFYDPFVPEIQMTREHPELAGLRSIAWSDSVLSGFDLAIICTDHDAVDYDLLVKACPLVLDTRNICAKRGVADSHVVKA